MTPEPVDRIIITAQQDFDIDIDVGLNPVQIQIRDDTIKKIQKCSL